jgi:ORF6N domain
MADAASCFHIVRGQRVLLDADLALLYGVSTKSFNQAVRRNLERFPADVLLQLTDVEAQSLRSQIVTLNKGRGHNLKYSPMAFTEHGAIMAATILNSPRAVLMLDAGMRRQFAEVYGAILALMGPATTEQ